MEFFDKKEKTDIEAEENAQLCELPPRPENGLKQYWLLRNAKSLDGLPGVQTAHKSSMPFKAKEVSFLKDDERDPSLRTLALVGLIDFKVVVAFLMGMLVSVVYVKFSQGLRVLHLLV